LLEYCNHPGGTELSELRRANGSEAPFGVRHWCLGNEVDGPWQIGQKSADEYGQLARETAKLMRWVDPTLALTACGSSNRSLRSYGRWEDRVLEHCHDDVDFISVHAYFENPHADTAEFLGNIELLDRHVREVAAIADAVGARRHSPRQVMVAVDEWNIWYRARSGSQLRQPGWPEAPALLEEVYTFEDALAAGGALCVLMNNADRVKIACQAQLVNAIGAIMTRTGGPAWRQTIFHPFALASRHARGRVLRTAIDCGAASSRAGFDMPYLVASATHDAASGHIALFVLNRHLREPMDLHVSLRGIPGEASVTSAWELHHPDLTAANSESDPQQVEPRTLQGIRLQDGRLTARLQPASWNVIVLAHAGTQPAP
jgi:alpha-N-arabinofuranosidase